MSFGFRDPDGTTLEWVGPLTPTPGGQPDNLGGPSNNCKNLHNSYAWHKNVLGLNLQVRLNPTQTQDQAAGSLGNICGARTGASSPASTTTTRRSSSALGQPELGRPARVADPRHVRRPVQGGNHLGMINLTYEVDDVRVVYEKLRRLKPRTTIVAPPETGTWASSGSRRPSTSSTPTAS